MIEGVDYAFSRPSPAALVAAGKQFAVRYLSGGRSSKDLTASELKALTAAGLNVCLVWETSGGAAKGGRNQGIFDARIATKQAASLGLSGVPIYFAVDFDAQGSTLNTVVEYVKGAASILGFELTGVYGGIKVIDACYKAKACKWLWETYAWSYGKWHPAAQLHQYKNGQRIGGGALDLCRATVADYGQYPRPTVQRPAPLPNTGGTDAPMPVSAYTRPTKGPVIRSARKHLRCKDTDTWIPGDDFDVAYSAYIRRHMYLYLAGARSFRLTKRAYDSICKN